MLLGCTNDVDFDRWGLKSRFGLTYHIQAGKADMGFAGGIRIANPGWQQANPYHPGEKLHQLTFPYSQCDLVTAEQQFAGLGIGGDATCSLGIGRDLQCQGIRQAGIGRLQHHIFAALKLFQWHQLCPENGHS